MAPSNEVNRQVFLAFPELNGQFPPAFQILPVDGSSIVRVSVPRFSLGGRSKAGWVARWVTNGVVYGTLKSARAASQS